MADRETIDDDRIRSSRYLIGGAVSVIIYYLAWALSGLPLQSTSVDDMTVIILWLPLVLPPIVSSLIATSTLGRKTWRVARGLDWVLLAAAGTGVGILDYLISGITLGFLYPGMFLEILVMAILGAGAAIGFGYVLKVLAKRRQESSSAYDALLNS